MSVATAPAPADQAGEEKKKGKGKLIIIVVVVLAVVGAAAYFFLLKPSGDKEPEAPVAGEVVAMEPIQINLAAGHYLSVGVALQLVEGAHEADGSQALDATISTFSGEEIGKLNEPKHRNELKEKLLKELEKRYHHEVMDVYFTSFVTQ